MSSTKFVRYAILVQLDIKLGIPKKSKTERRNVYQEKKIIAIKKEELLDDV